MTWKEESHKWEDRGHGAGRKLSSSLCHWDRVRLTSPADGWDYVMAIPYGFTGVVWLSCITVVWLCCMATDCLAVVRLRCRVADSRTAVWLCMATDCMAEVWLRCMVTDHVTGTAAASCVLPIRHR